MQTQAYLDPRIAFNIGEDYAFHGLGIPDKNNADLIRGHEVGKSRFRGKPAPVDRYVRKWLQMRVSAWWRNRKVMDDVTVDYLRDIDTPLCPVSGVTLTHGTGADTDWSIDRLCNDGAYARGNLAVISTRVNNLKGTRDIEEVVQLLDEPAQPGGLTRDEVLRLVHILGFLLPPELPVYFAVPQAQTPYDIPMHHSDILQRYLWQSLSRSAMERKFFWDLMAQGAPARVLLSMEALRAKMTLRLVVLGKVTSDVTDVLQDEQVRQAFMTCWSLLLDAGIAATVAMRLLHTLAGVDVLESDVPWVESISLETRGYC